MVPKRIWNKEIKQNKNLFPKVVNPLGTAKTKRLHFDFSGNLQ